MNAIHSLLTLPGNVVAALMNHFTDDRDGIGAILQQLIVRQLKDQKLTKLEQAGSQSGMKPAIHDLFADLPFQSPEYGIRNNVTKSM